jgi:hypothetical protein
MSHYKEEAKAASHAKAKRMGLHGKQKDATFDDVHPYDGVPQLDSGLAGLRPIGKQRFRRGGKVAHAEGNAVKKNLGHRPRKGAGGPGLGGLNLGAPGAENIKGKLPPDLANINNPNMQPTAKIPSITPPPRPPEFSSKPAKPQTMTPEEAEQFMRSGKAGGGALGGAPNAKKIVAALAMRKKRAGLPYAPPGRGLGSLPPVSMMGKKKGGKVSEMEWEHSKKDLAEDKKLAKKHHMTMSKWEKSELDEKHDKQQSMKGLRRGGGTKREQEEMCWGGRSKRASGGRAKGKTEIKIMIGQPQNPQDILGGGSPIQMPAQPKPPAPLMPMPQPPMPAGGPPMGGMPGMMAGMPTMGAGAPMGGMPGARPSMPMGRKSGGRTIHQETEYGSGSGLGRLEKTKWPFFGESKKGGK